MAHSGLRGGRGWSHTSWVILWMLTGCSEDTHPSEEDVTFAEDPRTSDDDHGEEPREEELLHDLDGSSDGEDEPLPSQCPPGDPEPMVAYPRDDRLRLNHLQAVGTHNSYHLEPEVALVAEWAYSHEPLDVQLEAQGVRQMELDLHLDDGRLVVYHLGGGLDQESSCESFTACLTLIEVWSSCHPGHHALFIFLEPKDEVDPTPLLGHAAEIEEAILEVWPRERLLTPDEVRGTSATLPEAITTHGWPTLGETRGKAVFVLLDGGVHRQAYLEGTPALEGRLMFVTAEEDDPSCAILSLSPLGNEERIRQLVAAGFIVRSLLDPDPEGVANNDRTRMHAAMEAGVHLLSTDYPAPMDGQEYWLELPDGQPSRCNPISAPEDCQASDMEALAAVAP